MTRFALFWVLACAISWTCLAVSARGGSPPETFFALLGNPALLAAKFGPAIAGLLVVAGSGREARHDFVKALCRARPLPLTIALLLPFLLSAVALLPVSAWSGPSATGLIAGFSIAPALGWIALRTFAGGGLGEEPGIRGVALPALLECIGPRVASLTIGIAWAIWHVPVLLAKPPQIWVAQFVLTVSVSLILTFAWLKLDRSVPFAVLFHGSLNGWAAYASIAWAGDMAVLTAWQAARLGLLLLLALVLLPLDWRRREPPRSKITGDEPCSDTA